MPQKSRSDSAQALIVTHAAARSGPLPWPGEVVTPPPDPAKAAHALRIFYDLQQARPRDMWGSDLIALAHIAIALRQADEITQVLEKSGYLVTGAKGKGLNRNPLIDVLQTTLSRAESLSRRLGLGSLNVDGRTVANAARAEHGARNFYGALEDDGLLARGDYFNA
jgi:hypothetical protein